MYCTRCGAKIPEGAAFCRHCGAAVEEETPAPANVSLATPATSSRGDLTTDLKAAVEARRELGPEMEDDLVESFLARIDEQIQQRVEREVGRRVSSLPGRGSGRERHHPPEAALVVGGSLALSIPLIGAAGESGTVPVMLAVVIINMFYFIFRRSG